MLDENIKPTLKKSKSIRRRHRSRSTRSRRARRISYYLAGATLLLVATAFFWYRYLAESNVPAKNWYEVDADRKPKVVLPSDDTPHQSDAERWSYLGHVRTQEGHVYSFHYQTQSSARKGESNNKWTSQLSFIDHQTGKRYQFRRAMSEQKDQKTDLGFVFREGNWEMSREPNRDRLKAETPEVGLDLTLEEIAPPTLHGSNGLVDLDEIGKSYYYSRSRMKIQGTLIYGGKPHKVSGQAWFDHQWDQFPSPPSHYDRFLLQLSDGIEVLIYQLKFRGSRKPID